MISTIYVGIAGNSSKAASIWIDKFRQYAIEKGMEYIGPVPLSSQTIDGETYYGQLMEIEPAGQPIDPLDSDPPDYITLEIGVDSGRFTIEDLVPDTSSGEEKEKDLEQVSMTENESNTSDEQAANSDELTNANESELTDENADSLSQDTPQTSNPDNDSNLEQLRSQAKRAAVEEVPETASTTRSDTTEYTRSNAVREYVKARADGFCEGCDDPAPFVSTTGDPYFHAHHIHELSDGGSDKPSTVIALCPNCHYRVHHGEDGTDYNNELSKKLSKLEL